jgi:methyl-accepting chemotaxis protein
MIGWWRDLRLRSKLGACGLSFLLPIALLLYFLVGQMAKDIRLTRDEIAGASALDPLEDITESVSEHLRLTLARMAGENVETFKAELEAASRERFALLMARLAANAGPLGLTMDKLTPLGLTQLEPGAFVKSVQDLAARPANTPAQALAQHAKFLAVLTELREYLADSAKLVLDPELASYYLGYMLAFDIPRAQERLGQLYGLGYMVLANLPGADAERGRIEDVAIAWEQSAMDRIQDKLAKSQRALGGERLAGLYKAAQDYAGKSRQFLAMAKAVGSGDKSVNRDAYVLAGQKARDAGAALWDQSGEVFKQLLAERAEKLKNRIAVGLGVSLGSIAAAFLLAWTIVTSVTRPLASVALVATRVAEGKVAEASMLLEQACPTGTCQREAIFKGAHAASETGQLFAAMAAMISGLNDILGAVNAASGAIQSSAGRIAATARQLEVSATQQAASTVEVGATSKEISSTAGELADTMAEVLGVADDTSSLASEGRESLARMGQAMEGLSGASQEMTGKLTLIREKATGIGQLLSTIAKVAAQTNLLSLNAAIEAEKAGEFGPGFAVVAREIRRLADQTASAALDIERTIKDMQASVRAGAASMDGFQDIARQAAEAAGTVSVKLGRIIAAGEGLTPRISSVTDGMRLQADGADQISVVISQLAHGAGQTRDALAEFRQAAEELNASARGLNGLLSYFDQGR